MTTLLYFTNLLNLSNYPINEHTRKFFFKLLSNIVEKMGL